MPRAVAEYLNTDHTELYVTPRECREVIPKLPTLYDEPFADECQIPGLPCQCCALASKSPSASPATAATNSSPVTPGTSAPAPSGTSCQRRRARCFELPPAPLAPLRRLMGRALRPIPSRFRGQLNGDKLHKFSSVLSRSNSLESTYDSLISRWNDGSIVRGNLFSSVRREPWSNGTDAIHRLMYRDMTMYLPDDIMAKVDRASMGVSLESRAPLLDHRIVEFAWRLPLELKIRQGKGKWVLRQVLHRYVPKHLVERPKMGFEVPIAQWLRGPLRNWAADLLDERRLRNQNFLNAELVTKRLNEHLSGTEISRKTCGTCSCSNPGSTPPLHRPVSRERVGLRALILPSQHGPS